MQLGGLDGVTLDGIAYKDKPEESRRFLDRLGNPFGHIGVDRNGTTAIDFGVYGVPETYVVDPSGRIRLRHVGPLTAEDVRSEILPLVRQLGSNSSSSGNQGSDSRSSLETSARKPGRSGQP
jgi:cytochrome c biogenesis protein CcmG/thiol:disulfide interchange protein DsbE